MTDKETLKLALKALEEWYFGCGAGSESHDDAVEAIQQALAAPVQPAAWESEMRSELAQLGFEGQCPESIGITIKRWFDAYAESLTAQPAPDCKQTGICVASGLACFGQPAQKPVAWPCVIVEANFEQKTITLEMQCTDYKVGAGQHWLHTTPPAAQRQHVTDGSLCWCEPETSYTDPETGASVIVHKGPQ